jgi:hypothetical protein
MVIVVGLSLVIGAVPVDVAGIRAGEDLGDGPQAETEVHRADRDDDQEQVESHRPSPVRRAWRRVS